jgi:hypothetical protein
VGGAREVNPPARSQVVGRNTKLSDETISDVLHEAEVVLTAVYKRIKAAKGEQRRRAKAGDPRAVVTDNKGQAEPYLHPGVVGV